MNKMENCIEEQDDQFYDTREELYYASDWDSDCTDDCSSSLLGGLIYDVWTQNPDSVQERRHKFLKYMGVGLEQDLYLREESYNVLSYKTEIGIDRITENSGTLLRTLSSEEETWSSLSSMSSLPNEVPESQGNDALEYNFVSEVEILNDEMEFKGDELSRGKILGGLNAMHSEIKCAPKIQKNSIKPCLVRPLMQTKIVNARYFVDSKKKVKVGWLRKLGIGMCVADRCGDSASNPNDLKSALGKEMQRVRVHPCKKRTKELSSLYIGQELQAHEGSILKMKFSCDGKYLATAGEDGIVRVWKVIEEERLENFDTSCDPCVYFKMNPLSKIDPVGMKGEKDGKAKRLKSSDSTCVIFPPKVFHISEIPLHEFRGHSGDVLDLSWSNNGFLLSSSVDKTVRLWQVGHNRCLRVFCHNNYVTCVDFNPLEDNYFLSGSIDGKVRIWEVLRCKVVDYIDIREIITAVSYRPDAKGAVVGSMTGNCHFYNILDNHLKLDAQISLQAKKKSTGNRITGFEFSPTDPSKVMVSSADSLVRVLNGVTVISKFRGPRNAASQMCASFTADGKHILSVNEDSNVYIWNYRNQDRTSSRPKNIWSSESFPSQNASIAIPWGGLKVTANDAALSPTSSGSVKHHNFDDGSEHKIPLSSPDCFSLSRVFLSEFLNKGSATWPEETLINSSPSAVSPRMCKSEFKFLRNACQGMSGSPHLWGLVIVTAGWDGKIRTYHNYGLPICI